MDRREMVWLKCTAVSTCQTCHQRNLQNLNIWNLQTFAIYEDYLLALNFSLVPDSATATILRLTGDVVRGCSAPLRSISTACRKRKLNTAMAAALEKCPSDSNCSKKASLSNLHPHNWSACSRSSLLKIIQWLCYFQSTFLK